MQREEIEAGAAKRAHTRYAHLVVCALMERKPYLAIMVYEKAKLLPSTATADSLDARGYLLSKLLTDGSEQVVCFRGERAHILKPLRADEERRVRAFQAAVAHDAPVPHVTPFELVDTESGKHFLLMPKFALSLDTRPYLSEAGVTMVWEHMRTALEGLHAKGFVHADVKPSNICLNELGTQAVLVDLGSVARVGERTPSTPAYVPHGLRAPGDVRASMALDWWMLAMTLAEKACGTKGLRMGGGASMVELRAHLAAYLDAAVWAALEPRLVALLRCGHQRGSVLCCSAGCAAATLSMVLI